MEDVLDRLDDALRELEEARQQNEEELLREQAAKLADEIKAFRDRAQRLTDESARIHEVVKKAGKWERPVRTSLNDLRQQQEGLAREVRSLMEKKLENAAVFGRMLRQSADAMDLAVRRMDSRLDAAETGPFDQELEDIADAGIQVQQKLAVKRLDQLLEALKPDPQRPPSQAAGRRPPDQPPMGGGKPGEQLPPLAQLKALRALQADLAERTEAFDKAHPDRARLNDDEAAELEALEKMQRDVADLVRMLAPAGVADRPGIKACAASARFSSPLAWSGSPLRRKRRRRQRPRRRRSRIRRRGRQSRRTRRTWMFRRRPTASPRTPRRPATG
jgi:hypothetical protein